MAKWGEGDERWIVEDRPDGQNVGNWHWTEKEVTKIAEARLQERLDESTPGESGCQFKKVDKFSGFVNLTNRKGKLNVQYSLDISLKWAREVTNPTDGEVAEASGTVRMEEIFDDEPEANVVVDKKSSTTAAPDRALKEKLCLEAIQFVVELITDLKEGRVGCSSPAK